MVVVLAIVLDEDGFDEKKEDDAILYLLEPLRSVVSRTRISLRLVGSVTRRFGHKKRRCLGKRHHIIFNMSYYDHQQQPPVGVPPPQGYPPKDAYPPPGYPPAQGYPPPGYPPQGYPQPGYPPQQAYAPQYAQQPPPRQETGFLEGWYNPLFAFLPSSRWIHFSVQNLL
ncbi:hypothetical protein PIB30_075655 [Stylosanthes scabra]|uniref:Rhodopsin n=1 Tax=Stylosanthes scabra TaxID=79078 RepID=A0ABU6QQK8_9FABA|nr:hypothetical protein [Stylosanthes scabra]